MTEERGRRATDGEAFLRRLNFPTVASVIMLLTQVGLVGWAKWTIESLIADASRRAIEIHNRDLEAHPVLRNVSDLSVKLDRQREILEEVRTEVIRLRALQEAYGGSAGHKK